MLYRQVSSRAWVESRRSVTLKSKPRSRPWYTISHINHIKSMLWRAIDAADNSLTMSAPMDPPPVDSRKWSRWMSSPLASTCSTDHCLSLSILQRLLTLSNSKLASSRSQSRQHYINNGKSRTSKTNCIKRMTSTLS